MRLPCAPDAQCVTVGNHGSWLSAWLRLAWGLEAGGPADAAAGCAYGVGQGAARPCARWRPPCLGPAPSALAWWWWWWFGGCCLLTCGPPGVVPSAVVSQFQPWCDQTAERLPGWANCGSQYCHFRFFEVWTCGFQVARPWEIERPPFKCRGAMPRGAPTVEPQRDW